MDEAELKDDDLHDKRMARLAREREELARLKRIEVAALVYYTAYCRDEADDPECCINIEQHHAAQELRDALANKRSSNG